MKKAIVLVSGGLDSATCLMLAKNQGFACHALSFDYQQRHRSELNAARHVVNFTGASSHQIISLPSDIFQHCALTDKNIDVPDYAGDGNIPVTYVPARNTLFLSYALAWAESIGAYDIFIGVSAVDYSGYPDCRPEYIQAYETMANLATKCAIKGQRITLNAPLIHLNKEQTIELGISIGVDYSLTVSCYQANDAGEACGRCDSCYLRQQGFKQANIPDPTRYAISSKHTDWTYGKQVF